MARDEMIVKTLARVLKFLILVVYLCLRGTMEEFTRACLETFFWQGERDIMLSLCGLRVVYVVDFFTVLRAYKLIRLLARQQKS